MLKNAKIHIVGKSLNQQDTVTLYTEGTVHTDAMGTTIEYEEVTEENVRLKTSIVLSDGIVTVNKFGLNETVNTMVFERGAVSSSTLITPYGELTTSIRTEEASVQTIDNALKIMLRYSMTLENGDVINDSQLGIECRF